jgi:SAM-dependent methyltransferase
MPDGEDRPEIQQAYDRLASGYDREGDRKPANAYLERPATLSLVPDVTDARVLDAGCGAGHLARELVDRGAAVVGLDASREMLAYARDRVPEGDWLRADLGSGLPFGADTFDGVVSSLAFHYVREWDGLFRNLRRVLKPGGWVVFSVQHPHADFEEYDDAENYHERERVSAVWTSFDEPVEVPAYRRPLSATMTPALEAGFRLDRLREPTPTEEYRRASPDRYEYEATRPNFLCLRFTSPARGRTGY